MIVVTVVVAAGTTVAAIGGDHHHHTTVGVGVTLGHDQDLTHLVSIKRYKSCI